jgi:hypothetical protein
MIVNAAQYSRIRVMSPREVIWRIARYPLEKTWYLFRRWSKPCAPAGEVRFVPLIDTGSLNLEECRAFWKSNPWHDRHLNLILEGKYEDESGILDTGTNPDWHADITASPP